MTFTSTLHHILNTNIQPRDTRIVITNHIRSRGPRIDMNMLDLGGPPRNLRADEHLIQLLRALAKEIRVPLDIRHVGGVVDVDQTGDALERLDGLDVVKFVEIARHDDGCVGV